MTTIQKIDWAKEQYAKGDRSLSVLINRSIRDPREISDDELEQVRQQEDYIYHFMKEEQSQGRRID